MISELRPEEVQILNIMPNDFLFFKDSVRNQAEKDENIHGMNTFSSVKVTEGFMGTHRDSVFALLDCRWLAAGGEKGK